MNKIKIIDLLNMISKGEEVPKKFRIKGSCFKDLYYEYNEKYNCYDLIGKKFKNGCYVFGYGELNDEVEILEEEEKKIPEKLEEFGIIQYNLDYIDYKNIETLKEWLNKDFQTIYDTLDSIIKNQNKLIDYLKRKGE